MKKIIAVLLVLSMCAVMLSGCGKAPEKQESTAPAGQTSAQTDAGAPTEPPIELTLAYCTATIQPSAENIQRIEDAINALTIPDLNIRVHLEMPELVTHVTNVATEIATGSVSYDIMLMNSAMIATFAQYGFLADITDDLEVYGQDLIASYGDPRVAKSMNVNGRVYCVPVHKENSFQSCAWLRKDIVDKYSIDTSVIHSFDDLTAVYEKVSAGEPDMLMLALNSYGSSAGVLFDDLASGVPFGLVDPTEDTTVVDVVESQEFYDWVSLLHSWYQNGWIEKGIASNQSAATQDYIASGRAFSSIDFYTHPLAESDHEAQANGTDLVMVPLGPQVATTKAAADWGFSVSAGTKDVSRSVQLLNYISTTPAVMNLLNWGEEGVDYVVTENGTLDYPAGVTLDTVGYHLDCGWCLPNQFICTPWCNMAPDIYQQIDEYNSYATFSKAFGFTFDPANVADEMTAINQVVSQYYYALITGEADPDEYISKMAEALRNAGSEKVIAEMQSQLDAFLAG